MKEPIMTPDEIADLRKKHYNATVASIKLPTRT
jgi:hypothetical protein